MSLAPLTPLRPRWRGTPTCTSVREAGGGGHWITLHAADSDEGTVHVFIGGNGRVTKGPSSLVGSAIGHLASHPSVKSAEHHPPGHEPPGAKSHPQYAEHQPPEKPAPLPGKPYARLHGGAQTRQEQPKEGPEPLTKEQTHAGLQTAREQAKAATSASPEAKAADAAVQSQQAQADLASYRASKDRNPNPWAPHLSPPVNDAKDRELQEKATRAQLAHQAVQAQQQSSAQQQQAAGTAQAAQPVLHSVGKPGETDDEREQRLLAEHKGHKARFDQIFRTAHTDAGYKERRDLVDRMNDIGGEVQDIRDRRQGLGRYAGQEAPKPAIRPSEAKPEKPGGITKEHIQAKVAAGEHLTREEKGFVLNGYRMPKPKPTEEEPAEPQKAAKKPEAEAKPRDFQAEARAKRAAAAAEKERTEAAKSPEQRASEREAAAQPQLRQHREALLGDRALSHYFDRDALASHGHMLDTAAGRAELRSHLQGILDRAHAGDSDKSVPAQRLRGRIDDLERHIGQHGAFAVTTAHEPALGALGQAKHILPGAAGQKPLAADAATGPARHKPAQQGDPIQPQRAQPVGQLGLLGEHKPFEAPKAKSEAEQAARGGQKSLFGSSFANPNERQPTSPVTTPQPEASAKPEPAPSRADLHRRLRTITATALTTDYDRKLAHSALDLLNKAYVGYDKAGRSTLSADIAGRHHDAARDAAQRLLTSNLSSGNPTEVAYSRALHHLAQDALGSAHRSLREAEAHGTPTPPRFARPVSA